MPTELEISWITKWQALSSILTLCMWEMTSVCEQFWRALPFISNISSATSRSALSAGDPEERSFKLQSDFKLMKFHQTIISSPILKLRWSITNAVTVKFDSLIICLHKDDHVAPQVHHDDPLSLWRGGSTFLKVKCQSYSSYVDFVLFHVKCYLKIEPCLKKGFICLIWNSQYLCESIICILKVCIHLLFLSVCIREVFTLGLGSWLCG